MSTESTSMRWFPAICAYIQYAILILFGHMRDIIGKCSGRSRYLDNKRPHKGYADMLVSWENFYTKRVYHRIQDVFNRPVTGPPGATISVLERYSTDGNKSLHIKKDMSRKCINLGSYNYLGFADDWMSTCSSSVFPVLEQYPIACTMPGMECGHTLVHVELEEYIAKFVGKPSALVYNMGYGTNSTTIPALLGKGALIISDSFNHSSIVNGARASSASTRVFRHNDAEHLKEVLRHAIAYGQPRTRRPWSKIMVMVEGIYSMEGEIVDLPAIVTVCKEYKALLYVDEAHSIGALGATGRGICEYTNVDPCDIDILMGTFTKSFGGMGGYIAGSEALVNFLRGASAGSMYATALSPLVAAQVLTTFKIISGDDGTNMGRDKLESLRENANYFRKALEDMGTEVLGDKDSPVIPVLLYTPSKVAAFSRECFERNLAVVTVGFPATPLLLARVRFCLSAAHTKAQLDTAIAELKDVSEKCGIRYVSNSMG